MTMGVGGLGGPLIGPKVAEEALKRAREEQARREAASKRSRAAEGARLDAERRRIAAEQLAKIAEQAPKPKTPSFVDTGFKPQQGWKVAERGYNRQPTVYTDPQGLRHYTPWSTPWKQGYKKDERGVHLQNPVASAPYVNIGGVHITKAEARALLELPEEEQAEQLFNLIGDRNSLLLPDNTIIKKSDFKKLTTYEKKIALSYGLTALKQYWAGRKTRQLALVKDTGDIIDVKKVETVTRPSEKLTEYVKNGQLNVAAAIEGGHTNVKDFEGWKVTQRELNKLTDDKIQYEAARDYLKNYKKSGGYYSLVDILVSDDNNAKSAARRLFTDRDIEKAQKWIDDNWGVKEGKYWGGKPRKAIIEFYRKLTPWHEEKGETITSALKSVGWWKYVPPSVSGAAAPVVSTAKTTPMKYDDIVVLIGLGGVVGYNAITGKKQVEDIAVQLRGTYGQKPIELNNVYMVDRTGKVASLASLLPNADILEKSGVTTGRAGYLENIPPNVERKLEQLIPPNIKVEPMQNIPVPQDTRPMENIPVKMFDKHTGMMIFKQTKPEDIDPEWGFLDAQAQVAVADRTLEIKTNQILDRLEKERQLKETFRIINDAIKKYGAPGASQVIKRQRKRIPIDLYDTYSSAYQDYLRKRALLENARKSYVASLNPQPVSGNVGTHQIYYAASMYLAAKLGLAPPLPGEDIENYVKRVLNTSLSSELDNAVKAGEKAYQKAITAGATKTVALQKAQQAVKTAVRTATRTLVKVQPRTATRTRAATRTLAKTQALTRTAVSPLATTKPIRLPRGKRDGKAWTPAEIKSAIAWRDGFVVHAIKSPYRRGIDEKSFNIDNLPPGLTIMRTYEGAGSQQRSAKITGTFPKKLTVDVGNQDVVITRTKNRIILRHTRDTMGTTSRTTIKKGRNISKKKGRIFHTRAAGGTILSRRGLRGY